MSETPKRSDRPFAVTTNIMSALICILGCLLALWIAILQVRNELRNLWKDGIHETQKMQISAEDIRKIARLVVEEINKTKTP